MDVGISCSEPPDQKEWPRLCPWAFLLIRCEVGRQPNSATRLCEGFARGLHKTRSRVWYPCPPPTHNTLFPRQLHG